MSLSRKRVAAVGSNVGSVMSTWGCMCSFESTLHPMHAGDKKGQVAVWDHQKVYERTVYTMHRALTNQIRFFDAASALSCASASSDGKLKVRGAAARRRRAAQQAGLRVARLLRCRKRCSCQQAGTASAAEGCPSPHPRRCQPQHATASGWHSSAPRPVWMQARAGSCASPRPCAGV